MTPSPISSNCRIDVVTRLANSFDYALTSAEAEGGARSKNADIIDLTMPVTTSPIAA